MRGFISRDEVVHDAYDAGVLRTQEDQTPIAEEVIRSHEVAELYCEIYITVASVPLRCSNCKAEGFGVEQS